MLLRRITRTLLAAPWKIHVYSRPLASIPSRKRIDEVVPGSNGEIKLIWNDGTSHAFRNVWLRDQCQCSECVHPTTKQKLVDSASIPLDIASSDVIVNDVGGLKVTWMNDSHRSVYDGNWLRERAEKTTRPPSGPRLWKGMQRVDSLPTTRYDRVMKNDGELYAWLSGLHDNGLAIVNGVPLVKDTIRQFAERIAYVKETIYGQLFDVIAQPDDDATHLAYTSQALDLHTDMNYREKSPGFQMLHCLESKGPVDQGVSYFVDGFAAAEWLRHNHPSAFHILTSLPVEFAVHASRKKYSQHVPIICTDSYGNVEEIHVNNRTLQTWGIPSNLIMPFFAAYKTFIQKLRDGSMEVRFNLKEGDLVTFSNRRILHARTGYDSKKMRRYLQGCYLDYDEVTSKLDSLRKNLET
ncbi:gamma-butyrobetaine dioxygenase-like isoform X2 [Oscarella lobularis]|uniref:gamma-butyrobetaine dioxygenase-like isoform X2 n=1 Tax=Oscarella lobularis TaxID=121494 RepID=UPI003313F00D